MFTLYFYYKEAVFTVHIYVFTQLSIENHSTKTVTGDLNSIFKILSNDSYQNFSLFSQRIHRGETLKGNRNEGWAKGRETNTCPMLASAHDLSIPDTHSAGFTEEGGVAGLPSLGSQPRSDAQ